jgi:hypothetical protein
MSDRHQTVGEVLAAIPRNPLLLARLAIVGVTFVYVATERGDLSSRPLHGFGSSASR